MGLARKLRDGLFTRDAVFAVLVPVPFSRPQRPSVELGMEISFLATVQCESAGLRMTKQKVTLRPVQPSDEDLLFRLFVSAHAHQFAAFPEQQQNELLKMQFMAQQGQYQGQYPHADFNIVLADNVPVGRLYVWRAEEAIWLIDITILPKYRTGIGTALVRGLLREAATLRKPIRGHVAKSNRAWKLWQRLGFRAIGDDGVYLEIEHPVAAL